MKLPLFAQFLDDGTVETDVMDEGDFARFQIEMSFEPISYISRVLPTYKPFNYRPFTSNNKTMNNWNGDKSSRGNYEMLIVFSTVL